ncbi:E3 ubiquitin-protein ligase RNF25 [Solea senegalensis]|uniref:E3 ubiquitin-protein ligase RNF25 n=1 Tax=Solea senegalensis TaxID=28829 RepID=A0AAV6RHU9_SOLSE|nr:E3 ubiquitin-protein ligase RNF25 [Solea senegalensis]KAG7504953.1 E3 ubiquitin-protein ligase RNF25 [Solea senegalensis]
MAAENDVVSEIEVLQSIYLDELQLKRTEGDRAWEVSLVLYPSTAEDSVSQFVRLTLTLTLDQQYPSSPPIISIHNPRGLSDDKLNSVQKCLQLEAQSCLGSPVLYQLIEKAKEILTESNIPHGNCVICLYGFKEGETFTKTSCYHYFHSHCLGRYVSHSEEELRLREKELEEDKTRERTHPQELAVVCPVCREPLAYDLDELLSSPAPQLPESDKAAIGSDYQEKWAELQKVLQRQRSKGGVIDREVESNRFLIHINEAPSGAENGNLDVDVSPERPTPSATNLSSDETGVRPDHSVPGLSHCRGGHSQRQQNRTRGPRRGGRFRRQQGRNAGAAVTEHLERLTLSSLVTTRAQGDQVHVEAELCRPKVSREVYTEPQQVLVSADGQPMCLETEYPRDAPDSVGGRGYRGRRRGPHPSVANSGSPRYHWDGRASRSRGGSSNLHSRGSGPHWGHGRGVQQKVVGRERVKDEVL